MKGIPGKVGMTYKSLKKVDKGTINASEVGKVYNSKKARYLFPFGKTYTPFGKELATTNHAEIASLIGTTTRHLNRVIEKLSQKGILMKKDKEIFVLDWFEVEQLSCGLRYE